VEDAERGLIDADYGGGVIKQRIARPNEGKSGGYRSIILFRRGHRSFFVYGFAKSERDNIDGRELDDLKKLARHYLSFSDAQIAAALALAELREVACDDQKI